MQSITIENSLYVGSQNARFFVNYAVGLQFCVYTSVRSEEHGVGKESRSR